MTGPYSSKSLLTFVISLVVAFAERFQSPGGQEEFHFQAHGSPAGGEDGRSHQCIDGSRKDDNRHAIFHGLAPYLCHNLLLFIRIFE